MPTKVVSAVHGWTSEDYTMVPSVKEFKTLQAEIRGLRREIAAMKSSGSALERPVKSMQGSVAPLKNSMRTLKRDVFKELTDGEWKKILEREARAATQQLETSMSCLSAVKASLISEGIAKKMCKEQPLERTPKIPTRRNASGAKTIAKSSIRKKNKKQ